MTISANDLADCWSIPLLTAGEWVDALNPAMDRFAVVTPRRVAAFVGQVGHESGCGKWVRELGSNAGARYEPPSSLASILGNTKPGDGVRYLGRGPIQITGRANYALARDRLRKAFGPDAGVPDFEADPKALELKRWGAAASTEYWQRRGCNEMADTGQLLAMTRRINGGLNGLTDRLALYRRACKVLGIPVLETDTPAEFAAKS